MRAFIVLALIAVARADVGGYNYGAGGAGGSLGGSQGGSFGGGDIGGGSFGGGSFGGGDGSLGGGAGGFGGVGGGFGGGAGGFGGGIGDGVGGGSLGGGSSDGGLAGRGFAGDAGSAGGELNKEFYTFSAPEGEFEDGKSLNDASNSLKKNLRVIFIRAPEGNGLTEAALNLAKSAGDSKTAIYVLTKQADIGDLAGKLQNINSHNANKPEVHFVKYRTPEDAAHAQHAIQQQYDRFGGPSQTHHGGVAPVLDFASKAPAGHGGQHIGGGGVGGYEGPAAPGNSYIPPSSGVVGGPSGTYLPIVRY